MTTRKELIEALRLRYRSAAFGDRIKILDEFVALTCYHRKHALRVLRREFSPATEVRLPSRKHWLEALAGCSGGYWQFQASLGLSLHGTTGSLSWNLDDSEVFFGGPLQQRLSLGGVLERVPVVKFSLALQQ
jgi:hypothetical protein